MQCVKGMVAEMLEDVPQCEWMREKFSFLEESVQQVEINCASIQALELRLTNAEELTSCTNDYSLPDMAIAAITNELQERQKRKKSVVLHNIPETNNEDEDFQTVSKILQEVRGEAVQLEEIPYTQKPRVYRLGRPDKYRIRSIKAHLKTEEDCEKVLQKVRKLSSSIQYHSVVIQPDMTPMQRNQMKKLVAEKKRRNIEAIENCQEPDWTITSGYLHRKRQYQ